jgi:type I restriction enzyme, S subunit
MDAQQFLADFGHIANAPGGVARLRELVFSLASEGKLLADCEQLETTHLDKVANFVMGQAPPGNECNTSGNGTVFVKTGEFGELYPIVREWTSKPLKMAKQGDVLICVVGATVGKLNLAIDCAIGRSVAAIRPRDGLNTKYLYFMLMPFTLRLRSDSRGSAQGVIGKAELSAVKLRVPSNDEQSRIVAKVDELMALCDTLEAQQQARRKLQNNLRQSTLQAVASSQSPHELQATWTRLADNFGRLFDAPEDVADLRQTILDLAFIGNISEQSDKVSSDLVESLHQRKIHLSAEKRIKRETPVIDFPGIMEMLGSIPDQWAWVRLNDIASVVRGGSPRPAGDPKFYGGSIPFLKVADVTAAKGMFVERFTSTITEAGLKKTREISTRTVLLTNSGATLGVPAICEFRTTFNDGIAAFVELNDAVFDEYLYLFLKSKTKWLQDIASRGQGQPNLNTEIIRSMWFPLAPISEQRRIVSRVSELMRFCDELERNLRHMTVVGKRLAITAISSLTGIAIEQEEESMKAPQTELIAPLRLGTAPSIKDQAPLAAILARQHGEMSAKDLWQRFGGEIDAFYAQLKTEVTHGWIQEPAPAEMREKVADAVSA